MPGTLLPAGSPAPRDVRSIARAAGPGPLRSAARCPAPRPVLERHFANNERVNDAGHGRSFTKAFRPIKAAFTHKLYLRPLCDLAVTVLPVTWTVIDRSLF